MKRKSASTHRLAVAALDLAGKGGWEFVTAAKLARVSRAPLKDAAAFLANPADSIAAYITAEALKGYRHDARGTPRDALFDLLMRRFDVLQKHRTGMLALMDAARRQPAFAAAVLRALRPALAATLRAAKQDGGASLHEARLFGLGAIYAATLTAWRADSSPDLAATMAALDRYLGYAERLMHLCRKGR